MPDIRPRKKSIPLVSELVSFFNIFIKNFVENNFDFFKELKPNQIYISTINAFLKTKFNKTMHIFVSRC